MISIDGSLFIQIANFLLLIWVLNIVCYKPIRNVLIKRKEKINGMEKVIDDTSKEATDKEQAFAEGIKQARSEGVKEKESLIEEANQEEKRITEEINKRAQANLAEIREKISKDAEDVRASLLKEIDTYAMAIGQKILGRAIS
jgi:F-type H+-transporting ATPase subunit b